MLKRAFVVYERKSSLHKYNFKLNYGKRNVNTGQKNSA